MEADRASRYGGAEIAASRIRMTVREQYASGRVKAETGTAESDGPDITALHTAASAALALSQVRTPR